MNWTVVGALVLGLGLGFLAVGAVVSSGAAAPALATRVGAVVAVVGAFAIYRGQTSDTWRDRRKPNDRTAVG